MPIIEQDLGKKVEEAEDLIFQNLQEAVLRNDGKPPDLKIVKKAIVSGLQALMNEICGREVKVEDQLEIELTDLSGDYSQVEMHFDGKTPEGTMLIHLLNSVPSDEGEESDQVLH
jgi:hypothetical protein